MDKVFASFKRKDSGIEVVPCVIESVTELSAPEYAAFSRNLLADYDFIRDCEADLWADENGVNHCLLVLGEGSEDGILVRSEGYSYARYSAYLPNARLYLRQQMYPSLERYADMMQRMVEQFTEEALTCQDEGTYTLPIKSLGNWKNEFPVDEKLFEAMLKERPEFSEIAIRDNDIHVRLKQDYVVLAQMECTPDPDMEMKL